MYRTTIMLPDDLKRLAVRESARQGISMGEFIRGAVASALAAPPPGTNADPLFADQVIHEGDAPRDTAHRHDDYLYDREP